MEISVKDFSLSDLFELFMKLFRKNFFVNSVNEEKIIEVYNFNDFLDESFSRELIFQSPTNDKFSLVLRMRRNYDRLYNFTNKKILMFSISLENHYYLKIEIKDFDSDNFRTRCIIYDGRSNMVRKEFDKRTDIQFNKFVNSWKEKLNFLETYHEYSKHLTSRNIPRLYSLRKFFETRKYIKEIDEFNKRKDSDEYKNLLKDLIYVSDNYVHETHGYDDGVIKITKNGLGCFTIEIFKARFFFRPEEIGERIYEEYNFHREKDLLRIFLPVFKSRGGLETVKTNILRDRLKME